MKSNFDEIIERTDLHGSRTPDSADEFALPTTGGIFLLTIEYPHVDKYVNLSSDRQKLILSGLFRDIIHIIEPAYIAEFHYVYEYHKTTGFVHLHGYVRVLDTMPLYPIGGVCDMAKLYHSKMPKVKYCRYHLYSPKSLFSQYGRYKNPGICIQYLYRDDLAGLNDWKQYMAKEQLAPSAPSAPTAQVTNN